jgi:hypothetical protein
MQWSGIKNGQLLSLCVELGFDILLTIDKNLQYQQNLERYPLTIVIFNSRSSKVDDLLVFLPQFNNLLPTLQKHKAYLLEV